MAGPDIAPLHSITSLPPYTPAGSVAAAYTPSGGDAIACMNDTGGPVSAATTGGANTMMSANAVGKAPTGTVASTFASRRLIKRDRRKLDAKLLRAAFSRPPPAEERNGEMVVGEGAPARRRLVSL
jgi:hypothetical protein